MINNFKYFLRRCFVGTGSDLHVEDCIDRDKRNPLTDPRETSRSVSEMKEWTCSKADRPDGTVVRDCTRLYTGGTLFRVCYTNSAEGSTCICSAELCNGAEGLRDVFEWTTLVLLLATIANYLTAR